MKKMKQKKSVEGSLKISTIVDTPYVINRHTVEGSLKISTIVDGWDVGNLMKSKAL